MSSSFSHHRRSTYLLAVCLVASFFLSGYTLKNGKKQFDKDFAPPPYMVLVRQALVRKELGVAARFLKAARQCWQKRGQACGFHKHTYLVYLGVLTLQRGQIHRSVKFLQQAKNNWKRNPPKARTKTPKKAFREAQKSHLRLGQTLSFYLGQAYFRIKKYKRAVSELRGAGAIVGKMPGYYRLLALAELKAKYFQSARKTLEKGIQIFPKQQELLQVAVMLYLRVGALKAALAIGRRLLRVTPKSNATPFLVTVDAMRKAGLIYQVLPLLEEARLYMPKNREILLRLGIAYTQARMPIAAAQCFSILAPLQPEMAYYAAAAWMQAGNLRKALLWNQQVRDVIKRTRQRGRILLSQGHFARALVALQQQWTQHKLAPDGRYRLAYVAIRLGRYALAQKVLASLKKTPYAASGKRLKRTLQLCRAIPWRCLD